MTIAFADRRLSVPERLALYAGLGTVGLGAWGYLALMMRDMSAMAGMPPMAVSPAYVAGLFVMWLVMQAAMMLPSAVPMIQTYGRMQAAGATGPRLALHVALFSGGYLAAWSAFSLGAALLQAGLVATDLLGHMGMRVTSGPLAGGILIGAGLYQWLPLKHACLRRCRTPIGFLMTEWRDGPLGAFNMGVRHGLFCIGCCWALMCLLFAFGVMNAIWIAVITVYVIVEKIAPFGEVLTRLVGAGLVLWGAVLLFA